MHVIFSTHTYCLKNPYNQKVQIIVKTNTYYQLHSDSKTNKEIVIAHLVHDCSSKENQQATNERLFCMSKPICLRSIPSTVRAIKFPFILLYLPMSSKVPCVIYFFRIYIFLNRYFACQTKQCLIKKNKLPHSVRSIRCALY